MSKINRFDELHDLILEIIRAFSRRKRAKENRSTYIFYKAPNIIDFFEDRSVSKINRFDELHGLTLEIIFLLEERERIFHRA